MEQQEYDQLFMDLCKVVEAEIFATPYLFKSPTTRGSQCVKRILKVIAEHGIIIESDEPGEHTYQAEQGRG